MALYDQCRTIQLSQTEHYKGTGKSQTRQVRITAIPTGFSILPYAGGIMDQPYRMMTFFEIFLIAERNAVFAKLSS